ncbi:MAG: cupin domain-containing protein [Marinibacterium sp.]|nr:cupin domain-containing protein [Marinibacterium sp.]
MDIIRAGTRPSHFPNPDWFTGTVWFDPILDAPDPARMRALRVTFTPGARTAWHTHPLGQTLWVEHGQGLVGLRDAPPRLIHAGDTVWIPPGQEHWHGAAPDTAMTHLAIQEAKGDSVADWLDKVSDTDYLRPPA